MLTEENQQKTLDSIESEDEDEILPEIYIPQAQQTHQTALNNNKFASLCSTPENLKQRQFNAILPGKLPKLEKKKVNVINKKMQINAAIFNHNIKNNKRLEVSQNIKAMSGAISGIDLQE